MPDHIISIAPDGTVRTLYTDKIDLREFGPLHVERASNVEYNNEHQGWVVGFPDGTFLCDRHEIRPGEYAETGISSFYAGRDNVIAFDRREEALWTEVAYLQARL